MFSFIYNTIFYEPLLNGLIGLIKIIPGHDVGIAVIILTLIVRFIIFPFNHKSIIAQRKMKEIEPELKEIKEKHKKDQQAQAKLTMELYRKHGINPFSSFITLLIQLPIIFAVYKVFLGGVNFDITHVYSFVSLPEIINITFIGLIDVTQKSYVLAAFAAISQFFQMKFAMPALPAANKESSGNSFKDSLAKSMGIQMKFVMPVFIFFIALKLSSAIALYWTTMNVFAIVHEVIVKKRAEKVWKNK